MGEEGELLTLDPGQAGLQGPAAAAAAVQRFTGVDRDSAGLALRRLVALSHIDPVRFPLAHNTGSVLLLDAALALYLLLPEGTIGTAAAKAGVAAVLGLSPKSMAGESVLALTRRQTCAALEQHGVEVHALSSGTACCVKSSKPRRRAGLLLTQAWACLL